ncbi:cytosolic iron-sulfur assembly component 3 [Galendromus occidentalis]|uniref:Cytosolic iron-sulfur assembly component 3 n=1 Tax=Galendromus occidentalis TaxID=34638 RepID=A0AAJ7WHR2_9ACAR|nr:cytosolic iron-sulfur assembly component 3 [Galendromus occidentalis]
MAAAGFSSALKISDLNDFITPSQECIKPVTVEKQKKGLGSIRIGDDTDDLTLETPKIQRVQITLNDCLACSGCITSAESVLITQQSTDELLRILSESADRHIVVSIAPQARASFAAKYNVSYRSAGYRLRSFLKKLGVKEVLDTSFARNFTLIETKREFLKRYKEDRSRLPMLSSACPGFVCYIEKTHGEAILPFLSHVRSPQQVMGSFVKTFLGSKLSIAPDKLYHVTVMPCFDKKLEASRDDFFNEVTQSKDVDCVITPVELEELMLKQNVVFTDLEDTEESPSGQFALEHCYQHKGSGSGGFGEYVFTSAVRELFGEEVPFCDFKTLRNKDFTEVMFTRGDQVLLRVAICNGFRNIQNIVQRIKRGTCNYDFIEVMACPSGCLNGGAQLRPNEESPKELLDRVVELFKESQQSGGRSPDSDSAVDELYRDWIADRAERLLHTKYKAVAKSTSGFTVKW